MYLFHAMCSALSLACKFAVQVPKELMSFGTAVKKKESKLYGAHFKDVDMTVKASKVKFDSDDD